MLRHGVRHVLLYSVGQRRVFERAEFELVVALNGHRRQPLDDLSTLPHFRTGTYTLVLGINVENWISVAYGNAIAAGPRVDRPELDRVLHTVNRSL